MDRSSHFLTSNFGVEIWTGEVCEAQRERERERHTVTYRFPFLKIFSILRFLMPQISSMVGPKSFPQISLKAQIREAQSISVETPDMEAWMWSDRVTSSTRWLELAWTK